MTSSNAVCIFDGFINFLVPDANTFVAYGIVAGDSDLPVVNVGTPEKPSYLPADVCEVLPGQRCRSNLSTSQAQLMIRYAVRKPAQNAQSIVLEGLQVSGIHPPSNTLVSQVPVHNPENATDLFRIRSGSLFCQG